MYTKGLLELFAEKIESTELQAAFKSRIAKITFNKEGDGIETCAGVQLTDALEGSDTQLKALEYEINYRIGELLAELETRQTEELFLEQIRNKTGFIEINGQEFQMGIGEIHVPTEGPINVETKGGCSEEALRYVMQAIANFFKKEVNAPFQKTTIIITPEEQQDGFVDGETAHSMVIDIEAEEI